MNRNVAIVVIILVLVVIAGYLVWWRNQYQVGVSPQPETQEVTEMSPSIQASPSASPSASPKSSGVKESTGSAR